ncbi:Uncharacterised protein [Mycobacteroides abscessus subsp. abscessus]|nr:Uncharacterised protein [Mycobacteroides abscessus subsp. abscessus]
MNRPASAAASTEAKESPILVSSRAFITGTPAIPAMASRGVHNATARRRSGAPADPPAPKISCSTPDPGSSVRTNPSGAVRVPADPAATSTTSRSPSDSRFCTSIPLGHTVTRLVTGGLPHHLSLATNTTEPSSLYPSSLYGPDDGNFDRSRSVSRFHWLFQKSAIFCSAGTSLEAIAPTRSMLPPSLSATTCHGNIVVAVNNWVQSVKARSGAKVTRAVFWPGLQSTVEMSAYPAVLAVSKSGIRPDCANQDSTMSSQVTGLPSE